LSQIEDRPTVFARALFAFVACPGTVALALPLAWLAHESRLQLSWPPGLGLLAVGTMGLLWCVRDFYVAGKGTLAPWSPPLHLVVVGLYGYSRNPMYVAVTLMLLGWALSFGSAGLLVYTAIVVTAFHLRVVLGEERWLARTFGEQWRQYAGRVPRWL
jgi:protein-S-isoprenylcysteine O-methyltransferase Ste14